MAEDFFFQVSSGFFIGFATMYALKKSVKVIVVLLGIYILTLLFLEYTGVITVKLERFDKLLQPFVSGIENFTSYVLNRLYFSASAVLGALTALKVK